MTKKTMDFAPTSLPASVADQLTLVGRALFGKSYKARLTSALGINRSTLFEWMRRRGQRIGHRDIDAELIELLDLECSAASMHAVKLSALRRQFMTGGHHAAK